MGRSPWRYVALLAVFVIGVLAGVYGFAMLVLLRDLDVALAQAAGGLALVAWVIFHPARVPEHAQLGHSRR